MPAPGYGMRINEARRAKRLTQLDLCKLCGFGPATVSLWENEKTSPQAESWHMLAKALDTSVEQLRDNRTLQTAVPVLADLRLIDTESLVREVLRRGFALANAK